MSVKNNATTAVLLASLSGLLTVLPANAQSVKNEINVRTNTGGNTINDQSDDKNITTGSTNTQINVDNQLNSSNQATTSAIEETDVRISTQPWTETIITLSAGENDKLFKLTHRDDQAFVEIINQNGEFRQAEFDNAETFSVQINGDIIEIQTGYDEFIIDHADARTVTKFPILYDIETDQLSLELDDQIFPLNTLPRQAVDTINTNGYFDELTNVPLLISQNGQIVYQFEGTINRKLFGLFPITTDKTITLSTQTGDIITNSFDSFTDQFLYALSL